LILLGGLLLPAVAQELPLTVCEYDPPESHVTDLALQGWFSWHDGPDAGIVDRSLTTHLSADYSRLSMTGPFGYDLQAHGQLRRAEERWTSRITASSSLQASITEQLFGVGVLAFDADLQSGLELDATAGIGTGRFRDATPLALAMRIQNRLLDLGELLAPVGREMLLSLAQILGEAGPTEDEKIIRVAERLVDTQLIAEGQLGVTALLTMEQILSSPHQTRLCGRDAQARIGLTTRLLPETSLVATGIVLLRYAAVPDPVSQLQARAETKVRLLRPTEMIAEADLSYTRSLPGNWTSRAEYRLTVDRGWSTETVAAFSHRLTATLTTELSGGIGLNLSSELAYNSGDDEITVDLTVSLEASLL
jgi:hypothetical protein